MCGVCGAATPARLDSSSRTQSGLASSTAVLADSNRREDAEAGRILRIEGQSSAHPFIPTAVSRQPLCIPMRPSVWRVAEAGCNDTGWCGDVKHVKDLLSALSLSAPPHPCPLNIIVAKRPGQPARSSHILWLMIRTHTTEQSPARHHAAISTHSGPSVVGVLWLSRVTFWFRRHTTLSRAASAVAPWPTVVLCFRTLLLCLHDSWQSMQSRRCARCRSITPARRRLVVP